MNKQRNTLLEMVLIFAFLGGICFLVWHINPYSTPKQISAKAMDSTISTDSTFNHKAPEDKKWVEGKSLFKSNCASCHNPKVAQTGPALIGVTKRWQDAGNYKGKTGEQWLHIWIKNWNEAVASGYPYAVNIQHYNETAMNVFTNLTDEQIDAILTYIETPSTGSGKPVAMQ
jgi:mono/diheme cytochrome c family protein